MRRPRGDAASAPRGRAAGAVDGVAPETLTLPNSPNSVKFAVIGDSGRGNKPQRDVAEQMARYHERFAFPFTIMLGDNLYEGAATPEDYRAKFEEPYKALLDRGRPRSTRRSAITTIRGRSTTSPST